MGSTIRNTEGEAVHYPPVQTLTRPERHPRYLSLEERTAIADLRRRKRTVREIARELGRSPATISRELRRNADEHGRYLAGSADRAATQRMARLRDRRIQVDAELRRVVLDLWRRSPPTQLRSLPAGPLTDSCPRADAVRAHPGSMVRLLHPARRPATNRRPGDRGRRFRAVSLQHRSHRRIVRSRGVTESP